MERFFQLSLTFCILSVAGLEFTQVVFRYVLKAPVIVIEEILIFPTIWMYFLGCAAAAKEGSQITANIIGTMLKNKKAVAALNAVAMFISTAVSCWLSYWAFDYLLYSLETWKTTPYSYIPLFFAESSVFIGMALITIYTFAWFVHEARKVQKKSIV